MANRFEQVGTIPYVGSNGIDRSELPVFETTDIGDLVAHFHDNELGPLEVSDFLVQRLRWHVAASVVEQPRETYDQWNAPYVTGTGVIMLGDTHLLDDSEEPISTSHMQVVSWNVVSNELSFELNRFGVVDTSLRERGLHLPIVTQHNVYSRIASADNFAHSLVEGELRDLLGETQQKDEGLHPYTNPATYERTAGLMPQFAGTIDKFRKDTFILYTLRNRAGKFPRHELPENPRKDEGKFYLMRIEPDDQVDLLRPVESKVDFGDYVIGLTEEVPPKWRMVARPYDLQLS